MYSRKDVEKMIGIPALRIKFYTEQGICPGVAVNTGRGNERRYSKDDVVILAVARTLAETGISLSVIKAFFKDIQNEEVSNKGRSLTYDYLQHTDQLEYFVIDKIFKKINGKYVHFASAYSFPSVSDEKELLEKIRLTSKQVVVMIFNLGQIFKQIDWLE